MDEDLTVKTFLFLDHSLVDSINAVAGAEQHHTFDLVDAINLFNKELGQFFVSKSWRDSAQVARAPLIIATGPGSQPFAIRDKEDAGRFVNSDIESFLELLVLAEHLLPRDIDKADTGIHGAGFRQHGDASPQRAPEHDSGRDAKIVFANHFRLFQRQADHLFEGLFDIGITTDIIPAQVGITDFVKKIHQFSVHDFYSFKIGRAMLPDGKRHFLIIMQLNRLSNLPEISNNHATLTESEASLYWINTTRAQGDVMPVVLSTSLNKTVQRQSVRHF